MVRCGDWNVQGNEEFRSHQNRAIDDVIIHPEYSTGATANTQVHNNFAILHIDKEFDLMSEHINHVCLPENPDQRTGIYISDNKSGDYYKIISSLIGQYKEKNCFAMGWGKERFDSPSYQQILREIS